MPILLSVEDAGRSLLSQMKATHNLIQDEIHSLRSKIFTTFAEYGIPQRSQFPEEYEQWHSKMQGMLEELEYLAEKLNREFESFESAFVVDTYPPSDVKNIQLMREWWHNILRNHGKYSTYAILLVLPSDRESLRYLKEYGRELDLISGDDCLVLTFGDSGIKRPNFEDKSWISTVEGHVTKGYSINIANIFNIEFSKFPCLVIFNDVRSSEHIVVTFKGFSAEGIAEKLRVIFTIIKRAVKEKENPIKSLELKRKEEIFQKAGNTVLSEIRDFAGKTLETAMEAIINANIK
ncbi:MAG: WXG100 family type VII secretion target [Chloroflexota bacterium]|nr:MAG: WXG100 family type VII secretion target [Chloroflexota bacterium]